MLDNLGRLWIENPNSSQHYVIIEFFRILRVALRRGLGGVTPGVGWRYAGVQLFHAGLLILNLSLAYSFTAQPTTTSSASALRIV